MLSVEQKLLSTLAHLFFVFTKWILIGPAIAYIISKDDFTKQQAIEAAVFQVAAKLVIRGIETVLVFEGLVPSSTGGLKAIIALLLIAAIFILPIIATIQNIRNKYFSYPITGYILRNYL